MVFWADHEYLTNQRERDLPVGESERGPSREPATGRPKRLGNWVLAGWSQESSHSECDDGRVREVRAPLAGTKLF
jgi:hypothetical protein